VGDDNLALLYPEFFLGYSSDQAVWDKLMTIDNYHIMKVLPGIVARNF